MPASEPVELVEGLWASVDPIDQPRPVYFTHERPTFDLKLLNRSDHHVVDGSRMNWAVGVGSGMPEPIHREAIDIEVPKGESRHYEIGGKLLAFEGHGVVGVSCGGLGGSPDGDERTVRASGSSSYSPVYTFSVRDEAHYELTHERPRRVLRWTMVLSGLVVLLALIQLATLLG